MSVPRQSEFVAHLREIVNRWWIIFPVALLVTLGVFVVQGSKADVYEATATLRFIVNGDDEDATDFKTRSYAELALTPTFVSRGLETSGLSMSASAAEESLSIELRSTTGFLDVTASGSSPTDVEKLANGMAQTLIAAVATEVDEAETTFVELVDPAVAPSAPAGRHPLVDAILAGLIATLVLGEAVVLLRKFSGRISPVAAMFEVREALGAPVFEFGHDLAARLPPFLEQHLGHHRLIAVIQYGDEPAGSAALTLAWATTQNDVITLVADVDTGPPRLQATVHQPLSPGISEILEASATLEASVRSIGSSGKLWVLPAGASTLHTPAGPARSNGIGSLLRDSGFECVFASITPSSEGQEVAIASGISPSSVVLVIDPTSSRIDELRRIRDRLTSAQLPIAAVILSTPARGRTARRNRRETSRNAR